MSENVVRYGFLVRSANLSTSEFHEYWEHSHGKLVLSLEGFRKYTTRYVQNHLLDEDSPLCDGIVATSQRQRPDYTIGLYHEPDYAILQVDERYMLDLDRTVSVLSDVSVVVNGDESDFKAIVLLHADDPVESYDARRVTVAALRTETASALGFGPAKSEWSTLVELWFDSEEQLLAARREHETTHEVDAFFPVRAVVMLDAN